MSKSEKLQNLNLETLGLVGVERFGDLTYRLEVAERIAQTTGADHAVFFDDVINAVPEAQRRLLAGLPGYERVILPALLMAPGFPNGASIICAAPPNPVEIKNFKRLKDKLGQAIGEKILPVRLFYEDGNNLVDLMTLSESEYQELCNRFAQRMQDPQAAASFMDPTFYLNLMEKYADRILNGEKTYVSPFQCTTQHAKKLEEFIKSDRIVIPDIPNMDKAYNNLLLASEGLGKYLPILMAIHADGTIITDFDNYFQKALVTRESSPELFAKTEEGLEKLAKSILMCIDYLSNQGLPSIVKLDSNGVSGLGNLMPGEFPQIYDQRVGYQTRLEGLVKIMEEVYQNTDRLPQFAVVEEFVNAKKNDGFRYDLTVGGMMVDGVFMPLSIFPFGTDSNGIYDRGWIAARPELIGEDEEIWKKLFEAYSRMGEVMAKHGYRNGVLAGDVLIREDGGLVFHDYNFRRGGRSTPEALIALRPETGWFEVQLKLSSEHGLPHVASNEKLLDIYTWVCQRLTDEGVYPFSTSFGYFGWGDGTHPFMKLKLLVPIKSLKGYSRDAHTQVVQDLVTNLLSSYGNYA